MLKRQQAVESGQRTRSSSGLWLGVAGGLAAIAILAMPKRARRFEDRQQERRNPWHFFLANSRARRRQIDLSGQRPLFERRQSAYEQYAAPSKLDS